VEDVELKKTIALNIIKFRKENNMTQVELAEKLNYSDKAISKWERCEVIPDIFTLNKIASLFNTSVSELCGETVIIQSSKVSAQPFYKRLIPYFGALLIIILFTLIFVVFEIINFDFFPFWLFLIYQIPLSFIPILVFNIIRHKYFSTMIDIYTMIITIILSLFITMNVTELLPVKEKSYIIWLIAAPLCIINLLWYLFQINKPTTKHIKKTKSIKVRENKL
jgi:transcriptional regulator with XRE-family HTH domain